LGNLKDYIPFLVHVADLKLPVNDPKKALEPILENVLEMHRSSTGDGFRISWKILFNPGAPYCWWMATMN